MIQDDYRVTIDLGTTKVCTIVGRRKPDGTVEIMGVGMVPSSGMKRGLVSDPRATTEAVQASVAAASEAAGVAIHDVYVGLTGSHVESKNLWTRLSNPGVSVVTQSDIRKVLQIARDEAGEPRKALLHVIPRCYALDGIYGVRNPLGMHASDLYVRTHAILGEMPALESIKSAVEAAGVSVAGLVVQPVAAAEAALTESEKDEGTVLVDVGGGTTDVAVFYEGAIVRTAVVPVGGLQFTNDIAIAFDCSAEEAERIKLTYGHAAPDTRMMREEFTVESTSLEEPLVLTRRELGQLVGDRATELFRMVMNKLNHDDLEEIPLNRMVLTGGAANLPGLQSVARFVFQGQVRIATPRGVESLPEEQQSPAFSASVGLLLWNVRNVARQTSTTRERVAAPAPSPRERVSSESGFLTSFRSLFPGMKAALAGSARR